MAQCGLSPLAPHRNGPVGPDPPALKTGSAECDPRGFRDSSVSPLRASFTVTLRPVLSLRPRRIVGGTPPRCWACGVLRALGPVGWDRRMRPDTPPCPRGPGRVPDNGGGAPWGMPPQSSVSRRWEAWVSSLESPSLSKGSQLAKPPAGSNFHFLKLHPGL